MSSGSLQASAKASLFKRGSDAPAKSATVLPIKREPGIKIAGLVSRVISQKEDSDYCVLEIETKGTRRKLVGNAALKVSPGMRVIAEDCQEEDTEFGKQFSANIIFEDVPTDAAGMVAYLAKNLDGVGRKSAEKMVEKFGSKTYEILDNEPERLLQVEGITLAKLSKIKASRKEEADFREISTALATHGIGGSIPRKVLNTFGESAMDIVRNHPYRLVGIPGMGFLKTDKVAIGQGYDQASPVRVASAMQYIIDERVAGEGHTAVAQDKFIRDTKKLTGVESDEVLKAVIKDLIDKNVLYLRELAGSPHLSTRKMVIAEKRIALNLTRLIQGATADINLSEMAKEAAAYLGDTAQIAAAENVYRYPVSVITGRPGGGKTTVTKVITDVAKTAGLQVVCLGPSNKSVDRLSEATGIKAQTVHSALRFQGDVTQDQKDEGRNSWFYNSKNPLKGNLFVIDEFGMTDTSVGRALLDAIPDGARIVFVGDPDQLASVSPGNVLKDIIDSKKFPVARLITPHRTAANSDIVINAYRIIEGDVKGLDLKGTKDFRFTQALTDEEVMTAVMESYAAQADQYGVDNVQVLVARYETGVGVIELNKAIRNLVNPTHPDVPQITLGKKTWRLGDRVIRNDKAQGISKSVIGIITGVDAEDKVVQITYGNKSVKHTRQEMERVDLAYAITTHKSQGSEFACVLMVMPRAHSHMFNRNLFYTGVTRGKKDVQIVGDAQTLRRAVAKPGALRVTGLVQEINKAFELFITADMYEIPPPPIEPPKMTPAHIASSYDSQQLDAANDDDASRAGRVSLFKRRPT